MLAILLAATLAHASDSEVGTRRRFGLGIAAGFPSSVTMKVLFDRKNGVALHVGPTLVTTGLHLRLQFEQRATELTSWDWGTLGLSWNLGVSVNLVFGTVAAQLPVRYGVLAGVGLDLRLEPVPVAAFVELSPVIYPIELAAPEPSPFLPAGVIVVAGGRFYF